MRNNNFTLGITKIIDETLAINTIDNKAKEIIREETLKLYEEFINLILAIKNDEELEDYEKNIDSQLNLFLLGYENMLNNLNDKKDKDTVKGLWIAIFSGTEIKNTSSLKIQMLKYAQEKLY